MAFPLVPAAGRDTAAHSDLQPVLDPLRQHYILAAAGRDTAAHSDLQPVLDPLRQHYILAAAGSVDMDRHFDFDFAQVDFGLVGMN